MELIDIYTKKLHDNHNVGADYYQRDLCSEKRFYELIKPVFLLLKEKPDLSLDEYRNQLYQNSNIEKILKKYVLEEGKVPGYSISYGTKYYKENIIIGNKEEVKKDENGKVIFSSSKMKEDTIFDLASTSKIFTLLAVLKLAQDGIIKLTDKIIWYAPQFKNLDNVTIFDLLTFSVPLITSERLDGVKDAAKAQELLFNISISNEKNSRIYTDMGAMVLKYVVESAAQKPIYKYLEDTFLCKIGMSDTAEKIDNDNIDRVAPTNLGIRITEGGEYIIEDSPIKKDVYDKKARILSGFGFAGHAGLFSTSNDMAKLGKELISYNIINKESLDNASELRTPLNRQYYGFLTFLKNRIPYSEICPILSAKSIASPGWCGTYFAFDPVNQIYVFCGTNRSHNRIISVPNGISLFKDEYGNDCIINKENRKIIDASKYSNEKDAIVEKISELLIQYRCLEDVINLNNKKGFSKEMHRTI